MTKCDFCSKSYREDGKLKCPYGICLLSQGEINEILKYLAAIKNK